MKNKFIKNLHQIIIFGLCEIIIILPLIGILILMYNYDVKYSLIGIIWIIIVLLIILYFLIGFYWIFQTVIVNDSGLTIKLFNKTLRNIKWENIQSIEYGSVMRHSALIIKLFDDKNINLDYRKPILNNIKNYVPTKIIKEKY